MATASDNPRKPRVLTFSYDHGGEARTACLEVTASGDLQVVKCANRHQVGAGLGTAIKAAVSAVGVKPCGGCERRAAQLDAATPGWVAELFGRLRRVFL